ncbi:hypothetical protein FGO68_gene6193 [Halteria grandinella]|uniref:Uncharacterized protein n=1 Tax=Halteria grandinella TaxID=5974 RepID=A0A8J8T3Q3_HALGN|nr:hypothetical protein FGO68_gene6193 [Halteria grandinella]
MRIDRGTFTITTPAHWQPSGIVPLMSLITINLYRPIRVDKEGEAKTMRALTFSQIRRSLNLMRLIGTILRTPDSEGISTNRQIRRIEIYRCSKTSQKRMKKSIRRNSNKHLQMPTKWSMSSSKSSCLSFLKSLRVRQKDSRFRADRSKCNKLCTQH